jgi:hypothetical protein
MVHARVAMFLRERYYMLKSGTKLHIAIYDTHEEAGAFSILVGTAVTDKWTRYGRSGRTVTTKKKAGR